MCLLTGEVNNTTHGPTAVGGTFLSQKPRAKSAQGRKESQPSSFEKPERRHNENNKNKRPESGMDKEQQKAGEGSCVKKKESNRFLRISPMNIHVRLQIKSSSCRHRPRHPRFQRHERPQKEPCSFRVPRHGQKDRRSRHKPRLLKILLSEEDTCGDQSGPF